MRMPIFAFLRWAQQNPKLVRFFDLLLAFSALAFAVWQGSIIWGIVAIMFLLAAIFRLGERVNLFLPKLKSPSRDKDA